MDDEKKSLGERLVGEGTPTPDGMQRMHKGLMYVCIFFFVYLIIQSFVLMPFLILRYGWW